MLPRNSKNSAPKKSLELQRIEALIFQQLQYMNYEETADIFPRDAALQTSLTLLPDDQLLHILNISDNSDHLLSSVNNVSEDSPSSLLSRLLRYYSEVGQQNIFSDANLKKVKPNSIGL